MAYLTAGCWERVQAALATGEHALLYGPPGTGKTHAGIKAALNGREVFAVTLHAGTFVSDVVGTYVQVAGDNGPHMVWQDAAFVLAARRGARLVINEIDRASDEVLGFLYGLLDSRETAQFCLPTGEVITPAPGFQAVCTMNGERDALPEGLQSRLAINVLVTEVAPGAVAALPEDVRGLAMASAVAEEGRRISIREWHAFVIARGKVGMESALDLVFGNRASDVLDSMTAAK